MPNESAIEQICALSGDDPDVIAAQIQAARAADAPARAMWLRIAARMSGAASTALMALVFILASALTNPIEALAYDGPATKSVAVDRLYIVLSDILAGIAYSLVRLRWCLPACFWLIASRGFA